MNRKTKPRGKPNIAEIRRAVADYMASEGCSCCQDMETHIEHTKHLANLLQVPEYKDGSGYDFHRFKTRARIKR